MRYLKHINETDRFYKEDNFNLKYIASHKDPFTKDELEKLSSRYDCQLNIEKLVYYKVTTMPFYIDSYPIYLYKCKDEWYYIATNDARPSNRKFYKCDQFEGLTNCLDDISVGIKG